MPELAVIPWQNIGLAGMAILAVALVLTGKLVPRSTLADAHAERDAWRTQAQDAIKEIATVTRAVEKQAEAKELSVALLQSVRKDNPPQEGN